MADRYTYVPSIGLFIAVSWGVPELLKKVPLKRVVCAVLASAVLLALTVCARKQVSYWSNSVRLFSHAIAVTANNYGAYNGLGSALGDLGRSDEAIRAYNEAVRINPDYTQAHNNLGVALMNLGRFEEAIFHYQEALRVYPNYVYAHNNLGVALMNLGRFEEAAFHFSEALRINPELHHAREDLETARRRMASQK
jgi:tetratricopeptide (TPR) repeat protein